MIRLNSVFLQDLTEEQREVVFTDEDVLLTAIPGSGKTRVITNKLVNDVSRIETAEKFIAITYTRRAAEEMHKRVLEVFSEFPRNVWIGTIHSFCLEFILRKFASFSEYLSKGFTVLGQQDMEDLQNEIKRKIGIPENYMFDWGLDTDGYPNEKHPQYFRAVENYFSRLREMKKVDFDYILYETYKLLLNHEQIRKNLFTQIRNFYIDEYQDTHIRQYDVLSLIVNYSNNKKIGMLLVGDANQAIYSGLGGIARNVQEINSIFNRKFTEKHLTKCFRSKQKVIDFYKKFAVKNQQIVSIVESNDKVHTSINLQIHKDELVSKIADLIVNLKSQGYDESEICIVAPQWYVLYHISNGLRKALPDILFDSPAIVPLKRDEDSVIYKLSKIILSEISESNIKRLRHIAKDVLEQVKFEYGVNDTNITPNKLINLIIEIRKNSKDTNVGTDYLQEVLNNLLSELSLLDTLYATLNEFIKGTVERINRYEDQGLEDDRIFFEKALRSGKGVVITTAHSIKGEEYDVMISYAMLEGMIPHWNDIYNRSDVEAQNMGKKLMFVVASRARDQVYFIAERGRKTRNGYKYKPNKYLLR